MTAIRGALLGYGYPAFLIEVVSVSQLPDLGLGILNAITQWGWEL